MFYQLTFLLVSVGIGLALGVYLRSFHHEKCESFGKWSLSLDWRLYAAETVFFALLAFLQVANGYWLFAAMMAGLAVLAGFMTYRQKLNQSPPTTNHG